MTTTTTTTTIPKPVMIPGPEQVAHDRCRIPQVRFDRNSYQGRHSVGFPFNFENLLPDQTVRLATIPVDWEDYPADPADLPRKHEQVQIFMDYYEQASNRLLSFEPIFADRWYRLPDPIAEYPQRNTSDFNNKLAQHAIDAVDPLLDFSTIDIVVLVFPDRPPIPVTGMDVPFASAQAFNERSTYPDPRNIFSADGFVRNYMGGAGYFDHPLRPVWSYYVHEAAHMFNLPDWYMREANTTSENFRSIRDREYSIGPLGNWGVMSSQDGPSRTFVAWSRWLLGWLNEKQVDCYELADVIDHGTFDTELVALDVYEPGVKAVMIRTGQHSGLVIESRRPVFPDHDLVYWEKFGRIPQGLIVYRVDTTRGNADGTLILVAPEGQGIVPLQLTDRMEPRALDALYNLGAVGLVDGLRIELIYSGDRDIVRISPQ